MFYFRLKMSEVDDEVYSTIFSALRHGVRRRILRMLSEGHMSFTSLYESLGVSSSHLTYHLDSLGELVSKNDAKYKLSVFGRASVDMMNNIESPPAPVDLLRGTNLYKLVSVFLIIALLTMSSLYYNLHTSSGSKEEVLALKETEIEALTARVKELSILTELSEVIEGEATLKIVSQQNLGYSYKTSLYEYPMTRYQMENSIGVFYAPSDNLNLKIRLSMPFFQEDFYLPVTLQRGNALLNESGVVIKLFEYRNMTYAEWRSPVIWSENLTQGWHNLDIELPGRGWYTLSLTGPIEVSSTGDPGARHMWGEMEDWLDILSLNVRGYSTLVDEGENPVFFAEETDINCGGSGWSLPIYIMGNNTSTP